MDLSKVLNDNYNIEIGNLNRYTPKTFLVECNQNNCYFIKKVNPSTNEKYIFLANSGVNNVIFPILNYQQKFVTLNEQEHVTVCEYVNTQEILIDAKAMNMCNALRRLHEDTLIPRQLSQLSARPKFEEITRQLDYKFKSLEQYIRTLETRNVDRISMMILGKYRYILDTKRELVRLQKRIILAIKDRESVYYSFVHNHPKLEHLLMLRGNQYLTSIENGKIGLNSLDMAKFYVENEHLNVDFKTLIINYYQNMNNDFYYDYFRYLVLLITIKKIQVHGLTYVTADSFSHCVNSIKKYFELFHDLPQQQENEENPLDFS